MLFQDTQSREEICLCNSEATLTFTLERDYYHGAVGAQNGKHLILPQKRRESYPKKVILTFTELHLKEPVGVFQKDKMEKGPPFLQTVVSPLSMGYTFQDPQWMPETTDGTKPYKYYVFLYIYTTMIKLNL